MVTKTALSSMEREQRTGMQHTPLQTCFGQKAKKTHLGERKTNDTVPNGQLHAEG